MKAPPLYGLVLNGGRSSRMGMDKGSIVYHNKPQRDHLVDVLQEFCDAVFVSAKAEHALPVTLPRIDDYYDLESPLNGILSAFHRFPDVAWITLPIDMPLLNHEVIATLLAHRDEEAVATCFADSEGKEPEPLLTVWEPRSAALLLEFFKSENSSPKMFLKTHEARIVPLPDKDMHININSREELDRFLAQRKK